MQKGKFKYQPEVLYFKRWSRKSFAIARSIGKVVHIAVLARHICQRLDEKTAAVTGEIPWRNCNSKEEKDFPPIWEDLILLFSSLFCCVVFGAYVLEEEARASIVQSPFYFSNFSSFTSKGSPIHIFSSCRAKHYLNTFYQLKIIVNEN